MTIPSDLKNRVVVQAGKPGISLAQFIRDALEMALDASGGDRDLNDPFVTDHAVYAGRAPEDSSTNHDHYLYGD